MSKQTRKQKREEERRILAEMDAAMLEQREAQGEDVQAQETSAKDKPKKRKWGQMDDPTPKRLHCRRCNTLMEENGYCPTCGYKVYMPMDEKKRNKVKLILTVVFVVVFVALFIGLQIKNG